MARHDVKVELGYSGDFHDHTATDEVYNGDADNGDDITITHGGRAESGGITPSTGSLVFRSWRFNPDNVTSDLYGLIRRNNPIRVTVDGDRRFQGEIASWTPRQTLGGDKQVPDRWVEVGAGGVLRRLQAGTDALPSSLRTFYLNDASVPVAYWPLDSGALSTVGLPEFGAAPFDLRFGNASYASTEVAAWLEPGAGINSGNTGAAIAGNVTMSENPARWTVDHMRRAGNSEQTRQLDFWVFGNSRSSSDERYDWILNFNPFTEQLNLFQNLVTPTGQTSNLLDTIDVGIYNDQPHHIRLNLTQDGTGMDWNILIDGESISTGTVASSTLQGVSQVLTNDRVGSATQPCAFAHIAVFEGTPPAIADAVTAAFGHAGEPAGTRFARLSAEQDVTSTIDGTAAATVPMGPQFRASLAEHYDEIARTDDGLVFDTVNEIGATYKTGRARYNQAPTLTLDYAAFDIAPPLQPVLDDKAIRNDVTVSRRDGGKSRAVDQESIDAVGRYTASPEVNTFSDFVLDSSAGWSLHVGTVSGTRFATVTVDLDASPHLVPDVVATDVGSVIALTNLPPELTPDTARLIVNGWTETIASDRRKITFNCMSESPYHVAELEHDDYSITGAMFTTTDEDVDADETGIRVAVAGDGLWSHEVDYDIVIGGERMTVTSVGAGSGTFPAQLQQLNVIRAVNGARKTHPIGAPVQLFNRAYIGM